MVRGFVRSPSSDRKVNKMRRKKKLYFNPFVFPLETLHLLAKFCGNEVSWVRDHKNILPPFLFFPSQCPPSGSVNLHAYHIIYCITGKSDHVRSWHAIFLRMLHDLPWADAATFVCTWV